jgi:hypothetical protein
MRPKLEAGSTVKYIGRDYYVVADLGEKIVIAAATPTVTTAVTCVPLARLQQENEL